MVKSVFLQYFDIVFWQQNRANHPMVAFQNLSVDSVRTTSILY